MFNWKTCLKYIFLNSLNFCESFIIYSSSLSLANILKLFIFLVMLTDFSMPLMIFHNRHFDDNRPKTLQNAQVSMTLNKFPKRFIIQSNMENHNNMTLIIMNNEAVLLESNSSIKFQDGIFWIEKYKFSPNHDNLIGIRKAYSNMFICTDEFGNILAQESKSLSENKGCVWLMEYSPFGVQFYTFDQSKRQGKQYILGTCYSESFFLCKISNQDQNCNISRYWFISVSDQHLSYVSLPHLFHWKPGDFHNLISESIIEESHVFCNQISKTLSEIAFNDIRDSLNIINRFRIGTIYLRSFLSRKYKSPKSIQTILDDIKHLFILQGIKKQKRVISKSRCKISRYRMCKLFMMRQARFKYQRKLISKINRKIIRLLIPYARLRYSEKLKWLKHRDLIEFIRKFLNINFPKKSLLIMATYFLQNYFNKNDIFDKSDSDLKVDKHYKQLFFKKIEEIFHGFVFSLKFENIGILKDIQRKFFLLGKNNVCYTSTLSKLITYLT